MSSSILFLSAALASVAFAKTDLSGCTSTDVSSPAGASVAWVVPGTGELCEPLDCGGGRAPPKTNVPGCPMYSGAAAYAPSYLAGHGGPAASSGWGEASATSADWSAMETDTAVSTWDLYTSAPTGAWSSASASWSSDWASESTWASESAWSTDSAWSSESAWSSPSSSATWATTTPAPGVTWNGTAGATGSWSTSAAHNGSSPSATASPSSTVITNGAAASAKAWMGSAAVMAGLGAVVAVL